MPSRFYIDTASAQPADWAAGSSVAEFDHARDRDDDHDDFDEGQLDVESCFVFDLHGDAELQDEDLRQQDASHTTQSSAAANSHLGDSSVCNGRQGLSLPDHVQIIPDLPEGSRAEQRREQQQADDDIGYYDQLDLDPTTAGRYYAAEENEEKKKLAKCPACGEEGHERKRCPHLLCMACGAFDLHSTCECPLSTCCFRCGGQGHRSHDCTLPRTSYNSRGARECVKCGSYRHTLAICPAHWRVYVFNEREAYDAERSRKAYALQNGHRSATAANGDAREPDEVSDEDSYVDEDEVEEMRDDWDPATRWCYNCTSTTHWGDDCPTRRVNPTRTNGEPSAFSEFVSRWGPYGGYVPPPPPSHGGSGGSALDGRPTSYAFTFRSDVGGSKRGRGGGDETTFHLSTAPPPSTRGRRDRERGDRDRERSRAAAVPLLDRFSNGPSSSTSRKKEKKASIQKKQGKKDRKAKKEAGSSSSGGGGGGGGGKGKKRKHSSDGPSSSDGGVRKAKSRKAEKKIKKEGGGASGKSRKAEKKIKKEGGGGASGKSKKAKVENKSMYRGGYD